MPLKATTKGNRPDGTSRHRHAGGTSRSRLLLLACVLCMAGPVLAHTDSPGSLPLLPHTLRLKHRTAAELVALFGRERLPAGAQVPRAARPDTAESLVPAGVDGILRVGEPHELRVVAREGVDQLLELIAELDTPVETVAPGRQRLSLTLRRADGTRLRPELARLPGAGSAVLRQRRLVLEGSPEWLHQALRQVIRAELGLSPLRTASPR